VQILSSVLAWDNPEIRFYPGEGLLRSSVELYVPLPELLLDAARRIAADTRAPHQAKLPAGRLSPADNPPANQADFPWNGAEARALALLYGGTDSGALLERFPAGKTALAQGLAVLDLLGFLRVHAAAPPGAAEALVGQLEEMLLRFETANAYEILSVPVDASAEALHSAYHQLAKQFHPDCFQSADFSDEIHRKAEKVFTSINEAYVTLKEPAGRALYNEKLQSMKSQREAVLQPAAASKAKDEKTAELLYREGRKALASGDIEKAVEHLKAAVWLCPENSAYHHHLGAAESQIPNSRKSAEQHLLKALELKPTSAASHIELAKLYIEVNLRRRAEQHIEQVLGWDAENPEALQLMAALARNRP